MQAYTEIIKSKSDARQYKVIQLDNGLRAMLIQDDEADKSCAALDVHVGCALDPKPLFGTAHFLEHMLFMGTEKYPSENEYAEFISNNGGYNNAYTTLTDTNYHFEVSNDAFGEALDRFAQFFLCPLLGEAQTAREMKAVDSEYNMSLQNDHWRKFNLIQNIAHEDSQLRRFMCGNLESLQQEGIRESLLNFHKTWYSSNIMNLVIYGKHSLEQLEQWATSLFTGVENKNVVVPDYSKPQMPFDSTNMGQTARYQPIKDKDTLELYWVLPFVQQQFRANPLSYYSHLIGHEGENSLLSYLKQEDYAMELSAGGDHELDCISDFTISITLTKKGLANVDKVVDAAFKYIQRLKEVGPQEWVFHETNKIGNMTFDFLEKSNPISYAMGMARNMPKFKTSDDLAQILRQQYVSEEYNPELLTQIVDILANPQSSLIIVGSKSFDDASLPIYEKWYKFNYSLEKMTEVRIEELRAAQVPDNGKALDLPTPNNLIATNFDILPEDATLSVRPQLVKQFEGVADLWYRKDDKFQKPKAIVSLKIYTTDLGYGTSEEAEVFAEVWKCVLEENLREFAYLAECAKLKFVIQRVRDNLQIQWQGYNSSLINFVSEIMQRIAAMKTTECREIFAQVKEKLAQEWKNHYLNQVFRLAYVELDTYLHEHDAEKKRLSEILETFDYEKFCTMKVDWLKSGRMLWYAYGNISKEDAIELCYNGVKLLNLQQVPKESLSHVRLADLSTQSSNFHRLDITVPDANNENSCLLSYYQYGREEAKDGGKINLLNKIALQYLQEPTFDQLRTKEQLGYVVFARPKDTRDIQSAWFLIQSPGKDCEHIRKRLDIHLNNMRKKVAEISDEQFTTIVGAVMTEVSEKDKNSVEVFNRHWQQELATHAYIFDRQERDVALLPTITKAEFQAFFEKLFFQENRANRFDTHWNSQLHIKQAAEGTVASSEETKQEEGGEAAAATEGAEAAAAATEAEPEFVPTYDTEMRHESVANFKRAMGFHIDNFKQNYTNASFSM